MLLKSVEVPGSITLAVLYIVNLILHNTYEIELHLAFAAATYSHNLSVNRMYLSTRECPLAQNSPIQIIDLLCTHFY